MLAKQSLKDVRLFFYSDLNHFRSPLEADEFCDLSFPIHLRKDMSDSLRRAAQQLDKDEV